MSKKQPDWDTKNPFRILPSTHGGQVTNFSRQDEMSDLTSLMEAEHDVQVLLTKQLVSKRTAGMERAKTVAEDLKLQFYLKTRVSTPP